MTRVAAALILGTLALGQVAAQQTRPARDAAPTAPQGTAVLSGNVVIDGPEGRPARRVTVMLSGHENTHRDTAVTDEQGGFEFRNIPAGRYLLSADKDGFVRASYGATRPDRAGTPIAIADGQPLAGITLRLVRGAVLTGVVRDPDGEPAQGVAIVVKRFVGSTRRLTEGYHGGDSSTDDRGVYRIYGLPAGDYVLQAVPVMHDHGGGSASARPTTPADVAWARAMLQSPAELATRGTTPPAPPAGGAVGYAPIYYPNTLQQSAAVSITLGAGEERGGLDFVLSLMPTFRVTGAINMPDGTSPSQAPQVYLAELSGNGSDWWGVKETMGQRFSFDGVAPGRYAVAAIMEDTREWAVANLTVSNQNQTVSMTLQPAMTATGQLVFQGTRAVPDDLKQVRLYWNAVAIAGGVAIEPPSVEAHADGTFKLPGLVPGAYRLSAGVPGSDPRAGTGWTMRSAMVGDRDIADIPLEVRPGMDVGKVVVTFTDKSTELSGRLQDASGRAASDYFIIVFSTDERTWSMQSRRITQTRPASDGQFIVRGLPPGEYFLAALTDVERDEWFDAGFLRELIPSAAKITLGEGEKKIQDIRIAK